ncbi:hypothetical protein [Leptospira wolffii]|nr:hypothetical protein [Leptospira wolffii]
MRAFLALFLFGTFSFCTTTSKFDRLREAKEKGSLLYVLRPIEPAQSVFSFRVSLDKFEGSFREGKRIRLKEWDLDSGEFSVLELTPGFYSLKCRDMDKIFLLKDGQRSFLSIRLYDNGPLSLPELFISELDTEAALRFLLAESRMYSITEK